MEINRILLSLVKLVAFVSFMVLSVFLLVIVLMTNGYFHEKIQNQSYTKPLKSNSNPIKIWKSESSSMLNEEEKYGKELIEHTAVYFSSKGKISKNGNGLNCQNCHLEAGAKPFGNNYAKVNSEYPKFRERSGKVETISSRINDCFERSLNGKAIDTNSKEMISMVAYIKWVGKNINSVSSDQKGLGMENLAFLDRKADVGKGKLIYAKKCSSCHGANGEGKWKENNVEFLYPPLWGENSYNDAAGLFRLSRFASFVYDNMPLGVQHGNNVLSKEEAWDVAAFVNSMPRPHKHFPKDWPDISKKPVDHPFGPFSDQFTEEQHKYGPFKPIAEAKTKHQLK
ncbi:MAG: c-type cytochrome [Cytophagales bacterium]